MHFILRAATAAFLISAGAAQAAGDPPPQYKPDDVVRAYSGAQDAHCAPGTAADPDEGGCAPVVRTRGFSLATPGAKPRAQHGVEARPARGKPIYKASAPLAPRARPGDLMITFELGSDRLTPQARANAHAFAQALAAPELASARFAIDGHTDASGAASRNLALSEARAQAVRSYLVEQGVDPARLEAKGYGSERLADAQHPKSPANRRVEALRLN
jgi:outer membrane protein OmpA-like peptidoglycan-associated protein